MNVLFLCNLKRIVNPFVSTLIQGLRESGVNAYSSVETFWNHDDFDILHIQWPEAIWEWKSISKEDYDAFTKRIFELKDKGVKIVYTKHNTAPHTMADGVWYDLYRFIENSADAVCHLGPMSISDLNEHNYVIEHHVYDGLYKRVNKLQARKRLGIALDSFIVLSFGAFRSQRERDIVLDNFKRTEVPNKVLLVPGLLRKNNMTLNEKIRLVVRKYIMRLNNVMINLREVQDRYLPYYFSAADVVIIQRVNILNSGNLPMAYYFGLPVIGPNVGNVGHILTQTNNFTFDPQKADFSCLLRNISEQNYDNIGIKNREYAIRHWTTKAACEKYKEVYIKIMQ